MAQVIRSLDKAGIVAWLAAHGVNAADEILEGFGFGAGRQPRVFEVELEEGEPLYQWMGNASAGAGISRGRWYALKGASMDGLGIFSAAAGRSLHQFRVAHPCRALEGDAAGIGTRIGSEGPRVKSWQYGVGGSGGATQIFIPRLYDGHIASLGPAES